MCRIILIEFIMNSYCFLGLNVLFTPMNVVLEVVNA